VPFNYIVNAVLNSPAAGIKPALSVEDDWRDHRTAEVFKMRRLAKTISLLGFPGVDGRFVGFKDHRHRQLMMPRDALARRLFQASNMQRKLQCWPAYQPSGIYGQVEDFAG
jgi:hypothetical protein